MPGHEEYTDLQIIDRIRSGEHQLYELLIRRNNPYLYRIGKSYGYGHQDVQDLMQETFISAYYHLGKFEGRAAFKTWITRIMLNHCYHKKQKLSFKNEADASEPYTEQHEPLFHRNMGTEQTILNKELGHVLENALNNIPEDYRIVFTLRELNGLSVAETAAVTQLTETNVKVRLNRAKAMLREKVEHMYQSSDIYEFNLVYCDQVVANVMAAIQKDPLINA